MLARDFREKARDSLCGNWGIAVLVGFVASVLGASMDTTAPGQLIGEISERTNLQSILESEYRAVFLSIAGAIGLWSLVGFVIGGAITLGYARFNLDLVDKVGVEFRDLFSGMDRLWQGFLMQFFRGLYIFLWTLLLIIPGIVATYSYALTPYIMAENPDMTWKEAIGRSKELMNGNRWRLFCLEWSFFGWYLLSVFTLYIGFLWVYPYTQAARAAFYRDLVGADIVEPQADYEESYL